MDKRSMQLACVNSHAVLDRSDWSSTWPGLGGAAFYLTRALERQALDVEYIGPLERRLPKLGRVKAPLYRCVLRQRYYSWAERSVSEGYARQVSRRLAGSSADLVFCPENAMPIAYLDCRQPIVVWTDAPIAALFDFYEYLTDLCHETRDALLAMEQAAFDRCALALFSSEWGAQAALRHYTIDAAKVHVVPWGANLDIEPDADEVRAAIERRPRDRCRLLFSGMWWARKGGDVALAVARRLNALGVPTELTVVGCEPPGAEREDGLVRCLGFLDKSSKEGREQLYRALAESHFLILPSRADCTPLVIGEANAFGLPCLVANVGGMATLVRDGVNGKLYPPGASSQEYAADVVGLIQDAPRYAQLAFESFQEYRRRLNWTVAAQAVRDLLETVR